MRIANNLRTGTEFFYYYFFLIHSILLTNSHSIVSVHVNQLGFHIRQFCELKICFIFITCFLMRHYMHNYYWGF